MKKLKSNKGISLIEMIVSVAILSISILSISNLVAIGINTNKRSEINQQGLILGQQLLEEIELLGSDGEYKDNITLLNMKLPSNLILVGNEENTILSNTITYKGLENVEHVNYDVEINLSKNKYINYDISDIDNSQEILSDVILELKTVQGIDNSYTIYIDGVGVTSIDNIDPSDISVKVMQISENSSREIYINDMKIATFQGNNIMLKFTKDYKHQSKNGITVNIYNNIQPKLNLYIQKSYQCNEYINIENKQGSLSVVNNLRDESELDNISMKDLYEIVVRVKHNDRVVFEGYANKNLNIKE